MPICKALDMSLVELLCDEEDKNNKILTVDYLIDDQVIIDNIESLSIDKKRRILRYLEQWVLKKDINLPTGNVSIIFDAEGQKVVIINELRFKRSKHIDWNVVEGYLKEYIGSCTEIFDTDEMIYIGSDFPDKFAKAKYGWYHYDTRFAIPKYNDYGELAGYNIFKGRMVIRHAQDNKLYLYDILEIKKETGKSCQE